MDRVTRKLTVMLGGSIVFAAIGYVFDPAHINGWAVLGVIPALAVHFLEDDPSDTRSRSDGGAHPDCHCTNCMNARARGA